MSQDRAAFAGEIADLPVADLLQTIVDGRHSGTVRFDTELGGATIWFRDGQLVDADMGRFHMEAAVRRLMPLTHGTFEVEFKPIDRKRVIETDSRALLDEARARAPGPREGGKRGPGRRAPKNWRPTGGGAPRSGDPNGGPAAPASTPPAKAKRGATVSMLAAADDEPKATLDPETIARPGPAAQEAKPEAPAKQSRDEIPRPPALDLRDAANRIAAVRRASQPTENDPSLGTLGASASEPDEDAKTIAPGSFVPARPPEAKTTRRADADPAPSAPEPDEDAMTRIARAPTSEDSKTIPAPSRNPTPRAGAPRPAGAPTPVAKEDSSVSGRVRRAAAKIAVPFEPERVDRTLMRPGPLPPPPQEPRSKPAKVEGSGSSSQAPSAAPSPSSTERPPSRPGVDPTFRPPPGRGAGTPDDTRGRTMQPFAPSAPRAPSTEATAAPPAGEATAGTRTPFAPPAPGGPQSDGVPHIDPHIDLNNLPVDSVPLSIDSVPINIDPPTPGGTTPGAPLLQPGFGMEQPAPGKSPREKFGPHGTLEIPASNEDEGNEGTGGPDPDTATRTGQTVFNARPLLRDPDLAKTMRLEPEEGDQMREQLAAEAAKRAGAAPATVGRYEVLLRLARGGMGTVYLARVTGEGGFRRLFALKVVRDHLSANPEYVRMLLQEARVASRLHHPNAVSIVDIGTLANQHYLVMDYVEGCTLSELLKYHRSNRPPQLIVPIVLDALAGLHAAHTLTDDDGTPLTLVHCDFSPQNLLVGANGTCRITDFGISRARNAVDHGKMTRGKPGYLSPEQVSGGVIDHRSDIFSAGVVLWNALTGQQLFEGASPEETLGNVLNRRVPAPSTTGLRPPAAFDPICLRALERDPARRYQSAEAMLMDLRRTAIAADLLGSPTDVAKWVTDTFGRQIELRRQAAGLAPRAAPVHLGAESTPIPVDRALVPTGGHGQGYSDGSDTASDSPSSSRTEMLPEVADDEGNARVRTVVFVGSALLAAAFIAMLVINPSLLEGGIIDDEGEYFDFSSQAETPIPDKLEGGEEGNAADEAGTGQAIAATGGPDTKADTQAVADTEGTGGEQADTDEATDGPDVAGTGLTAPEDPPTDDPKKTPKKTPKKSPKKTPKKTPKKDPPKKDPKRDPKKDPEKDPEKDPKKDPKKDPPKDDPPPPPPDLNDLFEPLGGR